MTIRITVNNDGAMPGRVVGVRTMTSVEDKSPGDPVFLHPGHWQTWYLSANQFLIVAECPDLLPGPRVGAPLPQRPTVTA